MAINPVGGAPTAMSHPTPKTSALKKPATAAPQGDAVKTSFSAKARQLSSQGQAHAGATVAVAKQAPKTAGAAGKTK